MYRPVFDQAHAAEQGEYATESEVQRQMRLDSVVDAGRKLLEEFGERLGGITNNDALPELLACLYAASIEMDRTAKEAGCPVMPFGTFDRATKLAKQRFASAAWTVR